MKDSHKLSSHALPYLHLSKDTRCTIAQAMMEISATNLAAAFVCLLLDGAVGALAGFAPTFLATFLGATTFATTTIFVLPNSLFIASSSAG